MKSGARAQLAGTLPPAADGAQIRKLAGHTLTYGVGAAAGKLLGLLLVPVYTRAVSTDQYGAIALLGVLASVLLLLSTCGITTAFFKFYYRQPAPARDRDLVTNATLAVLAFALPLSLLLGLLARPLAPLLLGPGASPRWLVLLAAANLVEALLLIPATLYRAQERPRAYVELSVGRLLLNFGLNVALVAGLNLGVLGVVMGNAVAPALLYLAVGVPMLGRLFSLRHARPGLVAQMVRYGLPLVPAGLALWALNFSDRFFLEHYASMREVGLYSLGYAFGFVVAIAALFPFQTAWSPFMFSLADRPDAERALAQAATYFLAFTVVLVLAVSVLSRDLIRVISPPPYWEAYRVVPKIALAYGLLGLTLVLCSGILLTRRSELAGLVYGSAGAINLGLNIALIPRFHQQGAAWATLLSAAILPPSMYVFAQRAHPIPYEWPRLLRLGGCALACYLVALQGPDLLWWGVALRLGAVAAFPVLLYAAGFYRHHELAAGREALLRALALPANPGGK